MAEHAVKISFRRAQAIARSLKPRQRDLLLRSPSVVTTSELAVARGLMHRKEPLLEIRAYGTYELTPLGGVVVGILEENQSSTAKIAYSLAAAAIEDWRDIGVAEKYVTGDTDFEKVQNALTAIAQDLKGKGGPLEVLREVDRG